MLGMLDAKHGYRRLTHDFLGNAAEYHVIETGAPVRGEDDQSATVIPDVVQDFILGLAHDGVAGAYDSLIVRNPGEHLQAVSRMVLHGGHKRVSVSFGQPQTVGVSSRHKRFVDD